MPSLAQRRLANQYLAAPTPTDAAAVVRALGAVQSQDYAGAKWAIAQRTTGLSDTDVERAFASGVILRTHVLRPTWHFVVPQDARWLLELTAPRVRTAMAYHHRKWHLDAEVFRKSHAAMERALRDGQHLTRAELTAALRSARVNVSAGERVGHLLMQAELDRVIISGARRGKQLTYALFDARVRGAPPRDRDEALQDLVRRYFATRGPATLPDFAWWSGLTVADAARGVEAAGAFLERERVAGRTYWQAATGRAALPAARVAHLLPNYDEYVVGFQDRSAFAERLGRTRATPPVNALIGHVVCVDGQIVGGWRRTLGKTVEVAVRLFVPLAPSERSLVRRAAERFGAFLGVPVQLTTERRHSRSAGTSERK